MAAAVVASDCLVRADPIACDRLLEGTSAFDVGFVSLALMKGGGSSPCYAAVAAGHTAIGRISSRSVTT